MAKFFDLFPRVLYDISGERSGSYDVATNLTIRLGIVANLKTNAGVYYPYVIQDGDTPEMIADKYYGDPTYHWVVLLMNDIVDPFYDWPLPYKSFNDFLVKKYGSIAIAQTRIARHERVIARRDSNSGLTTTSKMTIDETAYNAMAASTFNTYDLLDGSTVAETVTRDIIYAYDDEVAKNEAKRSIILLKKEYLELVRNDFQYAVARSSKTITATVLTEKTQGR